MRVLVEDGGSGYEDAKVTDNLGNSYEYKVNNGRIYQVTPLNNIIDSLPVLTVTSDTGTGAILRPVLGASELLVTGDTQATLIDCPI